MHPDIQNLIDQFDIESYLKTRNIQYKPVGQELKLNCPNCGDKKRNFYIHVPTKRVHCFRADTCEWNIHNPGLISVIRTLEGGCSYDDAIRTIQQFSNGVAFTVAAKAKRKQTPKSKILEDFAQMQTSFLYHQKKLSDGVGVIQQMPEEMQSLLPETEYTKAPLKYLYGRKIMSSDILRYRIGYCFLGKYAKHLIFPITYHHRVVSFIARGLWASGKYKKPLNADSWFFGFDQALHAKRVVIVEGLFDAIRVAQLGLKDYAGVALCGTNLTSKHVEFIQEAGWDGVIIALDPDASRKAVKMVDHLQRFGVETSICLMDKDPSDYSLPVLRTMLQKKVVPFRQAGWVEAQIGAMFG